MATFLAAMGWTLLIVLGCVCWLLAIRAVFLARRDPLPDLVDFFDPGEELEDDGWRRCPHGWVPAGGYCIDCHEDDLW